jgi:Mce-associated membrane protein
VSSRTAAKAQEGDTAVGGDTDPFTDESTPEHDDEHPRDGDDVDSEERDDLADEAEAADDADLVDADDHAAEEGADEAPPERAARFSWARLVAVVLPAVALVLAVGVGYLKWLDGSARESQTAAVESVRAASDSTIAILSYKPETVDKDLKVAADRLTGGFRRQYTQLVSDVVAPGAKQQHISAVATVPAAASVSATGKQAVVLVFVDQTTTIGNDSPTQTTSSVRVTLEKVQGRWLISQFDPV